MGNQRIFIISYYFAPKNEIAAVRLSKLTKYFIRYGWDVTVLTFGENPYNPYEKERDETLLSTELERANVIKIELPRMWLKFCKLKQLIKTKYGINKGKSDKVKINNNSSSGRFKSKLYVMTYFAYELFFNYLLLRTARPQIDNLFSKYKPEVIFSSYGPLVSAWLGQYAKKQSPNSLWMLDFRDPIVRLTDFELPIIRFYKYKLETNCIINADCISAVSYGHKNGMLERHKNNMTNFSEKIHVLTNGYDKEDLKFLDADNSIPWNDGILHLCYVGRLYIGKSKIGILAQVIQKIIEEKPLLIHKIKIHYAGSDFQNINNQFASYGLESLIVDHGIISRKESLQLQRKSHMLLLLSWNDEKEKGILPAKLLEYMMAERKVIGLVSGDTPNSEVKRIIESCNMGVAFEEANYQQDIEELRNYILDGITQVTEKNSVIYSPNKESIEEFSYHKISIQLINVIKHEKEKLLHLNGHEILKAME